MITYLIKNIIFTYLFNLSVPRVIVVQNSNICLSHSCRNNVFKKAFSFHRHCGRAQITLLTIVLQPTTATTTILRPEVDITKCVLNYCRSI